MKAISGMGLLDDFIKMDTQQGIFSAIGSFAIARRKEFYIIGSLKEGELKEQWFVNVNLNSSLAIPLRILQIEEVQMSNEQEKYLLLVIKAEEPDLLDLLLSLNIGTELIEITISGAD